MARQAGKVVVVYGLLLVACGGKSSDGLGAGGSAGSGGQAGSGAQAGTTQGGTAQGGTTSGQGGAMVTGGGPAVGGSAQGGNGGSDPECFPGEENTCECGGFSSCLPDGTWSPCECPEAACDNDERQSLDPYVKCARAVCIGELSTPAFQPCVVRCAQDETGVSSGCGECMADLVECAATLCLSDCLSDVDEYCVSCLCERGCLQHARYCAGGNTDLPACELPD